MGIHLARAAMDSKARTKEVMASREAMGNKVDMGNRADMGNRKVGKVDMDNKDKVVMASKEDMASRVVMGSKGNKVMANSSRDGANKHNKDSKDGEIKGKANRVGETKGRDSKAMANSSKDGVSRVSRVNKDGEINLGSKGNKVNRDGEIKASKEVGETKETRVKAGGDWNKFSMNKVIIFWNCDGAKLISN